MIKLAATDKDRSAIIEKQSLLGLVLIEEQDHFDGKWLLFGTSEEHAAKCAMEDNGYALRQEVADLKAQVATLASKVGTVESKVAVIEAKPVDLVKS